MNKTSKLFWPVLVTPKNAFIKNTELTSKSQKLMSELGLIKPATNGTYQIMPIGQRALDKCIELVHYNMLSISGQKVTLPVLTPAALWKRTGRLNGDITEFYMLRDRHGKEFLMSPTHEETITAMLAAAAPISYRQLPLRLYQVGPKFRDELKSRFGLMRAKEFLMKDMYSFDVSTDSALETYDHVSNAYENFFKQLEVPFVKVAADTGIMGGSLSHEYHYVSAIGEDILLQCTKCNYGSKMDITVSKTFCPSCQDNSLTDVRGIEVAHTFLLGDKYSKPLGATYLNERGKPQALVMGCYGIGITRVIAAALEMLSNENELRWPKLLAPFDICIIGCKQGSKEQPCADIIENKLLQSLLNICDRKEVLHDDRKYLTIGKRLMDAKRMGYPLIVVIGSKATELVPKLELHRGAEHAELELNDVLNAVVAYQRNKQDLLNLSVTSTSTANDGVTDTKMLISHQLKSNVLS